VTAAVAVQHALLSFLLMATVGVAFGWAAWRVGRRWGGRAIAFGWAAAVLVATGLMTLQIHRTQAALGFTPAQQARFPVFATFLPMWAAALGAVALVARRQLRTGAERFTPGFAGRSFGAWLLGAFAFFVVYAAFDVAAILR
jgi:hypothetical protein